MNCGSPARPPPRRPAATGRLAVFACLLLLAAACWAGPAGASYTCAGGGPAQTVSGHVAGGGEENCSPNRPAERTADAMSFVFFLGMMLAVVLVPVAVNKREETPPE
jgi:hypothetical protein